MSNKLKAKLRAAFTRKPTPAQPSPKLKDLYDHAMESASQQVGPLTVEYLHKLQKVVPLMDDSYFGVNLVLRPVGKEESYGLLVFATGEKVKELEEFLLSHPDIHSAAPTHSYQPPLPAFGSGTLIPPKNKEIV